MEPTVIRVAVVPWQPPLTMIALTLTAAALVLLPAAFLEGKVMKWTSNPYLIPPQAVTATTQYLVFHGALALNYTLSRVRCEALGGDLADVESMEVFGYLHSRLHSAAFIASFEGKTYGGSGLALYPGGAVAIPEGGAAARFPSICEVPLLGTYAIDLTRYGEPADRSVPVGAYGHKSQLHANSTDTTEQLVQAGFVKASRRDPRFAGLSAQFDAVGARAPERAVVPVGKQGGTTTQSVVTVTIYGSIETDPALPCCRCCNQI